MGLFKWLRRLLAGPEVPPRPVARFTEEGVCPYCGQPLPTLQARQCFQCGADWHDPDNVVQRPGVRRPESAAPPTASSPTSFGVDTTPSRRLEDTTTSRRLEDRTPSPGRSSSRDLSKLDTQQFAPLTTPAAKSQAKGLGSLWGNPWFGRRDLIPPVSDARTLLIDQAMVGQGLITPEELAEIHRIGEQMDEVRPDMAVASTVADAAVARSKEEREERKRQKKAEAAERRRLRQERIQQRRQTDIIYLGRGVSAGLADRRANIEKLQALGMPALAAPADIAKALELPVPRLRWLAFHTLAATRTHYIAFTVHKKSGGLRTLATPHRELARCQRWILRNILDKAPASDAAHGFVAGRSTLSNAAPHVNSHVVVNLDLSDFFPTITFRRVRGLFERLGYSPAASTVLGLLCTECPRRSVEYDGRRYEVAAGPRALPQGACTSPALSNLVTRRLDRRLGGLADRLGFVYTRYADDLTFSGDAAAAEKTAYLLARVRHIARDEGFAVNEKKTRVLRRNTSQRVTGVVVNERPGVPRKLVRRIRAILHRAQYEGLAAQNKDNHPNFEGWLQGTIAYILMINPRQGQPLREALDHLS